MFQFNFQSHGIERRKLSLKATNESNYSFSQTEISCLLRVFNYKNTMYHCSHSTQAVLLLAFIP